MTSSLIIRGGPILTGSKHGEIIDDGHVCIEAGLITHVGPGAPPASVQNAKTIDARDKFVIPGFVNAHTHLCMTLGRSLGSDRSLLQWLSEAQLPFMNRMDAEDYALAVRLGAIENLKAGNTTICEVFFSTRYADGADEVAMKSLAESGIRALFFRCSNDDDFAPGFLESSGEISTRSRTLLNAWAKNERLGVGVGPIVPWSASESYWADTVDMAKAGKIPVHLHTAETPEYNQLVKARTGKSNVEYLAEIGALGPNVMLNHCVHISEGDIELIAANGSPVIHDPTSNMILASGIAPVPELRQAGIVMGLACDGPACNNTQDMFEVMKDAALLHKVSKGDAGAMTAADVFAMATSGGAEACGLGDKVGRLEAGMLADVVLIDTLASHIRPLHDPLAALVYSCRAGDVHTVIVGGDIVVQDHRILTLDEQAVIQRAQHRADKLRQAS